MSGIQINTIDGNLGAPGATGATGATGAAGVAGPAPSGTGFVKVVAGVLQTPAALSAADLPTAISAANLADGTVGNTDLQCIKDLSTTGGTEHILRQATAGAAVTSSAINAGEVGTALFAGTTTGTGTAYVGTLPTAPTLVVGLCVNVNFHTDCTGAATLTLNGGASPAIYRNGYPLEAQGIRAGMRSLIYNGTQWDLLAGAIPIHPSALFGNQSDGDLTISSGTTAITRNMHYGTLVINGSGNLRPARNVIFADIIDLSAAAALAIAEVANNGGTGGVTGASGAGGALLSAAYLGGSNNGGAGGVGGHSTATAGGVGIGAMANGGSGGSGGATNGKGGNGSVGSGAAGGAGGAKYTVSSLGSPNLSASATLRGVTIATSGAGGGGGGGSTGNGANFGAGGGGGGGGGGWIRIVCRELILGAGTCAAGAISATGGTGGTGGTPSTGDNMGGGGGGSGGGGGVVEIVCHELSGTCANLIDCSGGNAGVGGNGLGTGGGGNSGMGGSGGEIRIYVLSTGQTYSVTGSAGSDGNVASGNTGGTPGGAGGACLLTI